MEMQTVIAAMTDSSVEEFARLLPSEEIQITRPPKTGLLMMAARDSFQTDFYLGEILVTEVEVEYAGVKGYAMISGDEHRKATLAASAEAVLRSGNEAIARRIDDFLSAQAEKREALEKRERLMIAATKVNFETMAPG